MYDLRKLEAFCRVYELRSFSKAGDALFLSQPTVSAHVQSLEKEVGVRLLDRLGRTVLPTPAGELLYRYCQRAFAELEAADAEINRLMGEVAGRILLGASTIPAGYILPCAVSSFLQKHPKVQLDLHVGDSLQICRMVAEGALMLGVVGAKEELPDLHYDMLGEDRLVIVCSPNWLKKRSGDVNCSGFSCFSMEDALSWDWIMREEGSGTRKALMESVIQAGYAPRELRSVLHVDSAQAAMRYAELGLGVTILSEVVVEEALREKRLLALSVAGLLMQRHFYMVNNERRESVPALTAFHKHLYEHTAALRSEK